LLRIFAAFAIAMAGGALGAWLAKGIGTFLFCAGFGVIAGLILYCHISI